MIAPSVCIFAARAVCDRRARRRSSVSYTHLQEVVRLLAGLFTQIAPIQSLLQVAVPEFLWSLCWMPLVYLIFRSIFRRVGGTRLA